MTMTNEKRQDGCAERCPDWCGTTFMLCDRCKARAANSGPVKAMVKWEPVAPWYRTTAQLNCTQHGDACLRRATYDIVGAGAACEACAERAGVFGPVSAYTPVGTAVASPKQAVTFTPPDWKCPGGTDGKPCPTPDARQADCGPRVNDVRMCVGCHVRCCPDGHHAEKAAPACAGPLATHGTPVLRWRRDLFGEGSALLLLCDACHLECEQMLMNRKRIAEAGRGVRSSEPPARIGTVPQVVSVGVGIWASRGMR